jgi:hypothetical protein
MAIHMWVMIPVKSSLTAGGAPGQVPALYQRGDARWPPWRGPALPERMCVPVNATVALLKRLAVRCRTLDQELAVNDAELDAIITVHAPKLRDRKGAAADMANRLLVTVGEPRTDR